MTVTAYPLAWPAGWPRSRAGIRATFGTTGRSRSGFKEPLTIAEACERLERELLGVDARHVTLSSNLELALTGRPRSNQSQPVDKGVAVYFTLKGRQTVLACDKWDRVADNIAAIAKHIEALRGMDRWGVGTADQAFAGYQALSAPDDRWWGILGVAETASRADIILAYRTKARTAHPDTGGSDDAMARLNRARDEGLERFGA